MYDILNAWIDIPFLVLTKPHLGAMCWALVFLGWYYLWKGSYQNRKGRLINKTHENNTSITVVGIFRSPPSTPDPMEVTLNKRSMHNFFLKR
jgi:hypothetical protein